MNGRAVHLNTALGQHAAKGAGRTVGVDAPEGVEEDLPVCASVPACMDIAALGMRHPVQSGVHDFT